MNRRDLYLQQMDVRTNRSQRIWKLLENLPFHSRYKSAQGALFFVVFNFCIRKLQSIDVQLFRSCKCLRIASLLVKQIVKFKMNTVLPSYKVYQEVENKDKVVPAMKHRVFTACC
jgi:hypothetical protein